MPWLMQEHQIFSGRKCQGYVYVKLEYWSTVKKIKYYLRHENKVHENIEDIHTKHSDYIILRIHNGCTFNKSHLQSNEE